MNNSTPVMFKPRVFEDDQNERIHIPGQRKSMVLKFVIKESSLPTLEKLDVTIKQKNEELNRKRIEQEKAEKKEEFDEETLRLAIELKKKAQEEKNTPIQKVEEESEDSIDSEEEQKALEEEMDKGVERKESENKNENEVAPRQSVVQKDDYALKIVTSLEIHDMKSFLLW